MYSIIKKTEKNINSAPWTNEVVYGVYCNDDLENLPIHILEQMRDHIEEIIKSK